MTSSLKIKVCGLKYPDNRKELEPLPIDYFGFIFYPQSKRYAGDPELPGFKELIASQKQKTGVFVNEHLCKVIEIAAIAGLSCVQLHGDESPEYCNQIMKKGFEVIKAFRIGDDFDFVDTTRYEGCADFFLFDTRAEIPGGTGRKYNWDLLSGYKGNTPFFLSGGIKPDDVMAVKSFSHQFFYGIDLNSGFEDYPGFKNFTILKQFIKELQK
jgi:phosphoribosylanthranilate isomerase